MANSTKTCNKNSINVNTVDFIQENVGKRIAATHNLDTTCSKNVVALVQEPYMRKNGKAGVAKPAEFLSKGGAAIYAPVMEGIQILPMPLVSSDDCTVAALTCSGCTIWVCSVYLDIKKPVKGSWVKVLDAARKASMPVLLGIDLNSHSFLYGDRENRRGLEMEDIIVSYDLEVHN
jgi:hypothetical protein